MRRLTASLLLMFALAGTIVPLAQAASASPSQACCRRMAHQCHSSPDSNLPVVHDTSCCRGDCCRALTTSQQASLQPWTATAITHTVTGSSFEPPASAAQTIAFSSHPSRAPPHASPA